MPLWIANKLAFFAEQRHPGQKPEYSEHKYSDPDTFAKDMQGSQPGLYAEETRSRGSKPRGDKIPEVCATCNGGWMSRLEQAVRLVMEGLLSGRPKTLDPFDRLIFATWITKTCLTYDASFTDRWIPSDLGTRRLYTIGIPLTYDHISIGHDPDYVSEGARVEARAHLRGHRSNGDTFTAVQFAFQFEHLVVRAMLHCFDNPFEPGPGLKLELGSPHHLEIWPRVGRVRWPSEEALRPTGMAEEPVLNVPTETPPPAK